MPVRIADAAVDPLVAHHREPVVFDSEVEQHAVALRGPMHAKAPEHVVRARHDVR